MALLSPLLSLIPSPPYPSLAFPSSLSARLQSVSISQQPTFGHSFQIPAPITAQKRGAVVTVSASADAQEPATAGESKDAEANIPLQDLPLESKLQLSLEQKMKMKLAKKIRLRRKRLMRKRKMRKRGNWPPSKMKKLKNV